MPLMTNSPGPLLNLQTRLRRWEARELWAVDHADCKYILQPVVAVSTAQQALPAIGRYRISCLVTEV